MSKVLSYLKTYYYEEFKPVEWIFASLFVIGFCYLNYFTDFITSLKSQNNWTLKQFNFYFILYAIPLFTGYLIQSVNRKDFSIFRKPTFILLCLLSVFIFSSRSMMNFFVQSIKFNLTTGEYGYYLYANYLTIFRSLVLLVPICIIWWFLDKCNQPLYGFTRKNFSLKPYFMMLVLMVPLIVLASTQSDFLSSYPRGLKSVDLDLTQLNHLKYFLLYELVYGLDFVNIELFFRGFLILAFLKYAGARAVMPVAMFYVIIHFGKPLGESISSFFGGTLLGIITLYGRSILGGIIVHVGIAYMMEIGALIGRYFKV
jgi:hypothetical protein